MKRKMLSYYSKTFDDTVESLDSIIKYMNENRQELDSNVLMFLNNLKDSNFENFQILYKINLKEISENSIKGKIIKLGNFHYEKCSREMLLKDLLDGKDVYEYPEFYFIKNK